VSAAAVAEALVTPVAGVVVAPVAGAMVAPVAGPMVAFARIGMGHAGHLDRDDNAGDCQRRADEQ
jgi:hypothetical protein